MVLKERGFVVAGNLKKFVNPRFIKTIDLALMKPLLARHEGKYKGFSVDLLDQEEDVAREALEKLLSGAEDSYPEGLRGDLHRIAELGDARGLEIIQAQAARQGVDLFPDMKTAEYVILTRGPWPQAQNRMSWELLFEDHSDNPFAIHLIPEMSDRAIPPSDIGRHVAFSAWTQSGHVLQLPGRVRSAKSLPDLRPWSTSGRA